MASGEIFLYVLLWSCLQRDLEMVQSRRQSFKIGQRMYVLSLQPRVLSPSLVPEITPMKPVELTRISSLKFLMDYQPKQKSMFLV